jgi:hypothetical protein
MFFPSLLCGLPCFWVLLFSFRVEIDSPPPSLNCISSLHNGQLLCSLYPFSRVYVNGNGTRQRCTIMLPRRCDPSCLT